MSQNNKPERPSYLNDQGHIGAHNFNDYQHALVNEAIDLAQYYALGDERKALSIRYYKQQETNNYDLETAVQHEQLNSHYYVYDFMPVIQFTGLNQQIQIDETKQGMNNTNTGDMEIIAIHQPMIGDLLNFYLEGSMATAQEHMIDDKKEYKINTEMFRVMDVQFLRTAGRYNVYRITIETAAFKQKSIHAIKSFWWSDSFRRWYPSKYMNHLKTLMEKPYLSTIKKYHHPEWNIVYDKSLDKDTNAKLNRVLSWIKYIDPTNDTGIPLIRIVMPYGVIVNEIKDPRMPEPQGLDFKKEDVWYPDENYVFDPMVPYSWVNGKIPNELAYCVWEIVHLYMPLVSLDGLDGLDIEGTNPNDNLSSEDVQYPILSKDNVNRMLWTFQNSPATAGAGVQGKYTNDAILPGEELKDNIIYVEDPNEN